MCKICGRTTRSVVEVFTCTVFYRRGFLSWFPSAVRVSAGIQVVALRGVCVQGPRQCWNVAPGVDNKEVPRSVAAAAADAG